MKEKTKQFLLSTSFRILISEWKELAKCIVNHSTPLHEKPITNIEELESFDIENLENISLGTSSEDTHILTEKQIYVVLQGPYGAFLKQKISHYAKIARFRLEIYLNGEELFKNKRTNLPLEDQVNEKKLKKINFSDLNAAYAELEQILIEHDNEWAEFIRRWTSTLLEYLERNKLELTEREIKELYDESLATEMLPRFIELSMKLPKKEYSEMSFADYLVLKAHLGIQSSLSRRHLSHEELDILDVLRNFKPQLEQMRAEENELLTHQETKNAEITHFLL